MRQTARQLIRPNAFAALMLLCVLPSVKAQTWGVRSRGSVAVLTPARTQNFSASADSGQVETTSVGNGIDSGTRTDTFSGTTGFVRASFDGTASLGKLTTKNVASATTTGGSNSNNEQAAARGSTSFSDTFTFSNPSLAPGDPISVRVSLSLEDAITIDGNPNVPLEDSGATISATAAGLGTVSVSHTTAGSSFKQQSFDFVVGNGVATKIDTVLNVNAVRTIASNVVPGGSITVDVSKGASFAVRALTTNTSYSTASGTTYPASISDPAEPRIVAFSHPPDGFHVSFTTAANRFYRVEAKCDYPFGPDASWTPISGAENVAGTGGVVEVTFADPVSCTPRFYRVVLLP